MRHRARRVAACAATAVLFGTLLAALAARQAPAPQPAAQATQPPTFRTEANFVRVDVYPTADGKPLLDLAREDFEVLEDGRPQVVDTFEHVRIGTTGPQPQRANPSSVDAMRQAAANPRSRVMVIFLDVPHVTTDGARNIGNALARFLNRFLAPDDLVGIMAPTMSAADVVLGRRTEVIEKVLRDGTWGRRFTIHEDDREALYQACYRVLQQEREQGKTVSDLAKVLTLRRREVLTLDALRELVVYLRTVREERKAILTVSEGWHLYKPDARITRLREECTCPRDQIRHDLQDCGGCAPFPPGRPYKEPVPGGDSIRVGREGKLTVGDVLTESGITTNECKIDRVRLAGIDNEQVARDIVQDANRANATFYTIDPRGLAVFDSPIHRDANEVGMPPNVAADMAFLRRRHDALATLAAGTDGLALINSNDLDAGLARIADDLSSYYLLGYYSTNAKLDGKYRSITVRVKRPGVSVRARRGYRAPTEAEVAAARFSAAPAGPQPVSALAAAVASLARVSSGPRFRIHAIPVRDGGSGPVTSVWVAGELPSGLQGWEQGGTVSLEIGGAAAAAASQVTLRPGERAFLTAIPVQDAGKELTVRARLTSGDAAVTPYTDSVRLDPAPGPPQALLFRRSAATGNRPRPAADFQFARTERARIEAPMAAGMAPGPGRLLDKAGQELKVPVTMGERTEGGQRWLTADIQLAALGAGDYVVEMTATGPGSEHRILTAIRVTR